MNVQSVPGIGVARPFGSRIEVYDAKNQELEPGDFGTLVRKDGDAPGADQDVNRAYDNAGTVADFFKTVLGRDSIDGNGMTLKSVVHYGSKFANAFWDGEKMVYGDGDGVDFAPLSGSLDVAGHEISHGVTEKSANLKYENQPGALNESFSDVFGELIEQWSENRQGFGTPDAAKGADWLIAEDVFTPNQAGDGLRSLKAPGTAYAEDPQPAHMDKYEKLPNTPEGDWGGVHINSGIPNKAAYEAAINLGSEKVAKIWYDALTTKLSSNSDFNEAAKATVASAAALYDQQTSQAISDAWKAVGLDAPVGSAPAPRVVDAAHHQHKDDGIVPRWLQRGEVDPTRLPA